MGPLKCRYLSTLGTLGDVSICKTSDVGVSVCFILSSSLYDRLLTQEKTSEIFTLGFH